mmetsp:Transcript_75904/g.222504  ORF Transcript_75904/g.222504 Transcript_75904/m.222504 type:complete len:264 (-) Transcript_75904:961-1752(-)
MSPMFRQSASRCRVMRMSAFSASAISSSLRLGSSKRKVSKSKASASTPKCSSRCTRACRCRIDPRSASLPGPAEPPAAPLFRGSQQATPLVPGPPRAMEAASQAWRQASPMATTTAPMPSSTAQAAKRGTSLAHFSPQTKVTATTLRLGAARRQEGRAPASAAEGSCHVQPRALHPSDVMPEKPHSRLPGTIAERTTASTASSAPSITGRSFRSREGAKAAYHSSAESSTSLSTSAQPSGVWPKGASSEAARRRSPYLLKRLL